MSYLSTDEMIKILIDRIGDHLHDPEPQSDQCLEELPQPTKLMLLRELRNTYNQYRAIMSGDQ